MPLPLDGVVAVSSLLHAFEGPTDAKRALLAQLDAATAVSHGTYLHALVTLRPALQARVAAVMASAGVSLLAFPSTPVPAVPGAGGLADDAVEALGAVQPAGPLLSRCTSLPAALGFPSVSVPVGVTKPRPGAVPGTAGAERLPVGLTLMGGEAGDELVLAAGRALQGLQAALADPVALKRWGSGVSA